VYGNDISLKTTGRQKWQLITTKHWFIGATEADDFPIVQSLEYQDPLKLEPAILLHLHQVQHSPQTSSELVPYYQPQKMKRDKTNKG
jgi:hypothetical protein